MANPLEKYEISKRQGNYPQDAYNDYLLDTTNYTNRIDIELVKNGDPRNNRILNILLDSKQFIETNKNKSMATFMLNTSINFSNANILYLYKMSINLNKMQIYCNHVISPNDIVCIHINEMVNSNYYTYNNNLNIHFIGVCESYNADTNIAVIVSQNKDGFIYDFTSPISMPKVSQLNFEFSLYDSNINILSEYLEVSIQYNDTCTISCLNNFEHMLNADDEVAFVNFLPITKEFLPSVYYKVYLIDDKTFHINTNIGAMSIATNPNKPCSNNITTRQYDLLLSRVDSRLFISNNPHFLNVGDIIKFNNLYAETVELSENGDGYFTVLSVDNDNNFVINIKTSPIKNINNNGFLANITAYTTAQTLRRRQNTLTLHVKKRRLFIPMSLYFLTKKNHKPNGSVRSHTESMLRV